MKILLTNLLCIFASTFGLRTALAEDNVVLIVVDQMPHWVSDPAQRAPLDLPALDSLATRGRVFSRAYTTSPVCSENRVALLTGQYPFALGTNKLDGTESTLGTMLKAEGYATGYVGKWHMSPAANPSGYVDPAVRPGWDYFAGNEGAPHNFTSSFAFINNDPTPISTAPWEPSWMTQKAIRFLRADRDKPFALVVSYGVPHPAMGAQGYTPPQTYYTPNQITPRPNVDPADNQAHKQRVAAYMGLCVTADIELGLLLAEIDLSTTFVIVTSDHGDNLYAHGMGPAQQKRHPWEESVHVPLVIAGPGIPVGADPGLMSTVDLIPSLLTLVGAGIPPEIQGSAFPFTTSIFLGHNAVNKSWEGERWRGLVVNNLRYSVTESGGDELLFDLVSDPYELNSLAGNPAYAPTMRAMRDEIRARACALGDPFFTP